MKTSINNLWLIFAVFIAVCTSCSSTEDTIVKQPYLSNLTNTGCLNDLFAPALQTRGFDAETTFEMIFEGSTARCKFSTLVYSCDFGKVNVDVTFEDGVMTIVEYPSSDQADCICETDATFTIQDMPTEDFILKIYRGTTTGEFNPDRPQYSGVVRIKDGSFIIPYHS